MLLEKYNVMIIVVSYGYMINYFIYGMKESVFFINFIIIICCKFIFIFFISDLSILGREMLGFIDVYYLKKIDLKIKYINNLIKEY